MGGVGGRVNAEGIWTPVVLGLSSTTDQSIPDATWTAAIWNREFQDYEHMHTAANLARITVPAAVAAGTNLFLVIANVRWASNASGRRQVRLMKNGTEVLAETASPASASPL
jgi:hypothetical protein